MPRGPGHLLVSICLVLSSCANEREPGLYATSASYVLRWDRSDVEPATGGGFVVRSDRGFEVRVDRAYLVQDSVTLVDCEGVGGDVWDDALAFLRSTLLPEAHAGHGEDTDPSAVVRLLVIDLVAADDETGYGVTRFAETRYCRLHYLVNYVYDASLLEGAPADLDAAGLTLYLAGAFRTDAAAWVPFESRTSFAHGVLLDLPEVVQGPLDGSAATVVLERSLGTMFDGVDFETIDPTDESIARAAVGNLNDRARVRVTVE